MARVTRTTLLLWLLAPAAVGLASAGGIGAPRAVAPTQLDVLLVVVDGLGMQLGSYGHDVKTPNLDRLAAMGRRFDRAYSQYPQAGPSRASLMTGWRPETTGVWRDKASLRGHGRSLVPIQKHFRDHGYFTARVGEVYGGRPEKEMIWELVGEPPAGGADAAWAAARAAQVLGEKASGALFLAVGLGRPPAGALEKFSAAYPAERMRLPVDAAQRPGMLPALALAERPDRAGRPGGLERPPAQTPEQQQQQLAAQYAYAAWVDAQVGVLLEVLDRLKLWETTALVLVGDCAPPLGGHGALPRSDVLFEETLRTPLIVVAPGVARPGAPSAQIVELVDVYPTLVGLAGLPAAKAREGTTLSPILADPARSVKTAAFSLVRRVAGQLGRSVRTERYRYTEWPDGSVELYDHQTDPSEFTNLAGHAAQAATVASLQKLFGESERGGTAARGDPASGAPVGRKPNVILVVADDMNTRLGSYGYDDAVTPNMDRLARMGRRFERAYAQVAMCSPSRTSFLTGRRPERFGIWDNLDPPKPKLQGALPIQEHFKAHGYFTARVGKMFHQAFDADFQWDVSEHASQASEQEQEDAEPPRQRKRRDVGDAATWSVPTDNADEQEPDGLRARRVAQLVEEHKQGPFFIALGFGKPHLRWVAPRKYFLLHPPERIRLPQEPADDWADIPEIAVEHDALERPGRFLSERPGPGIPRSEAIAGYSAAVSFVDAQLGVVFEALDRLNLWEETIVVVTGDHGYHLGEHGGLYRKDTLFEEALRVPLLIWTPGLGQPGTSTLGLAELLDLYPTLSDLAGLPRPQGLDGASLVPLLQDPARSVKSEAFSAARRRPPQLGRSVRNERYRYTEWPDGSRELYDHQTDPGERLNLAGQAAHAQPLADMRRRLDEGWTAALVTH